MNYLRVKALHLIPVFFLVTFASFMMLNLLPGDLVDAILLDTESAVPSAEDREALEKELNLDRPVIVRYGIWLGNMLQFDLGRSYVTTQPVIEALVQRIPVSLQLMVMAQIIAIGLARRLSSSRACRKRAKLERFTFEAIRLTSPSLSEESEAIVWLRMSPRAVRESVSSASSSRSFSNCSSIALSVKALASRRELVSASFSASRSARSFASSQP